MSAEEQKPTADVPPELAARFSELYRYLRGAASRLAARDAPGASLQPSDLVHEAYLKLENQPTVVRHGTSFFKRCFAAQCKRILVDRARIRTGRRRILGRATDVETIAIDDQVFEVLALDDALARLELLSTRMAKVVELRVFGGMTIAECAAELGVSRGTVDKEWRAARTWLQRALA